jgi:hypothetical protein
MEVTLGKMFDRAQEYVDGMTSFFADFRDRASNDYARLLTYHLARHKKNLSLLRTRFSNDELNTMLKIPLKNGNDDFFPDRVFDAHYLDSTSSSEEVISTAVEFIDVLVCLYHWLSDQLDHEHASIALNELIATEEREVAKLHSIKVSIATTL